MTGRDKANVNAVLGGLKDFQRDTVEYVYKQMYAERNPAHRFLVADEVGLGKTYVARGIIARVIQRLQKKIKRIDIVYICPNTDIAAQNLVRLSGKGKAELGPFTRITMLPLHLTELRKHELNFVSFTPNTSFKLKPNFGRSDERVLLYYLLKDAWNLRGDGPRKLLSGTMGLERFETQIHDFRKNKIGRSIVCRYVRILEQHDRKLPPRDRLRRRFRKLARRLGRLRDYRSLTREERRERAMLVGDLREKLAEICLDELQPDLIILDEFQRFKDLLNKETEMGRLADRLFTFRYRNMQSQPDDPIAHAHVLLLSATPYKMYALNTELDTKHQEEFLTTYNFLQTDVKLQKQLKELLEEYGPALLQTRNELTPEELNRIRQIKRKLEARLRKVMVRTERLAATTNRDGMLTMPDEPLLRLQPEDLDPYLGMQKIARWFNLPDTLEYWKSAPYLLNFMDGYQLKQKFTHTLRSQTRARELGELIRSHGRMLLTRDDVSLDREISPHNARLKDLIQKTIKSGDWSLLWLPPSLPYYQLEGEFARASDADLTKRLVFSSWRVVPKAISTLVSHEAQRIMSSTLGKRPGKTMKSNPLLRFDKSQNRLTNSSYCTGMSNLPLLYPAMWLAQVCDPLELVKQDGVHSLLTRTDLMSRAEAIIQNALNTIGSALPNWKDTTSAGPDKRWYWLAPVLLDLFFFGNTAKKWLRRSDLADAWAGKSNSRKEESEDDERDAWEDHVKQLVDLSQQFLKGKLKLRRAPDDLAHVLAQIGLAAPGVALLRALSRGPKFEACIHSSEKRDVAGWTARAFFRLFNQREVITLLRSSNSHDPYWRCALDYCVQGQLQAVLDEYVHVLSESERKTENIGETIRAALILRSQNPGVDLFSLDAHGTIRLDGKQRFQARFAMRFGDEKSDEDQAGVSTDQIRTAFNSPFWPFILITTSVGQEGLDFHTYCHAVVHWNLPSNPIDLEQREGRVHRYKGHAVRKNVARTYGDRLIAQPTTDPWTMVFKAAEEIRGDHLGDIVPYWVCEGKSKIERYVPAFPLSRDLERLELLSKSLTVYRMVLGQNRQEDIVDLLLTLPDDQRERVVRELQIDLSPRRGKRQKKNSPRSGE